MKEESSFRSRKDEIRKGLLKYTERAFRVLPEINNPRILDIGCGSGIPTLELARLSGGEITGIDIDKPALDKFTSEIEEAGLSGRVRAVNCSVFNMDFAEESFDIIWAEGSIYTVGFEKGLREWRRLLRPGGFLVVHDEQGNIGDKLEKIESSGYELLYYFLLSRDTWMSEYFAPLEKLVAEYTLKETDSLETSEELHRARDELDMFRKDPERNSSVYFIMKRKF